MTDLFVTERVKISELIPNVINPRKIKEVEKRKLWERILKYGMIGIPIRDADGTLLSGHQRCQMYVNYGFGEKEIDVRTAERKLTDAEIKEIMLIENTHAGEFDMQMLLSDFDEYVDLQDFGLDIEQLTSDMSEEHIKSEVPEYPIVPKYSEKYSAVIIVIENSIDENFVRSVLALDTAKDYKTENIGQSYVLNAKRFIELWEQKQIA